MSSPIIDAFLTATVTQNYFYVMFYLTTLSDSDI